MPRIDQEAQIFNFSNGKITEATPFTFPENSAKALNNVILELDGTVRRRKGLDRENSGLDEVNNDVTGVAQNVYLWENVNKDPDTNYYVVQIGNFYHIYDANAPSISGNKVDTVDLSGRTLFFADESLAEQNITYFASGEGFLFLVNKYMEPLRISDVGTGGNSSSGKFEIDAVVVEVRDFEGVEDNQGIKVRPSGSISDAHRYNLQNQGWPDYDSFQTFDDEGGSSTSQRNPVDYFSTFDGSGSYPSNSDIFSLGLRFDADSNSSIGAFSPWQLKEQKPKITLNPPKGHYIFNLFNKERSSVPKVSDTSLDQSEDTRPEAVAFFAGRLWLAFGETLLFSQVGEGLTQKDVLNLRPKFYQKQDPTSPDFNSLLPDDGGTITLQSSGKITNLVPYGNSIIAFSDEGVWQIAGTDNSGFTAVNYIVRKLTNQGIVAPRSLIQTDTSIYYWAEQGIYRIGPDENGDLSIRNITQTTIQSDYDNISGIFKEGAQGEWIRNEGKIYWIFAPAIANFDFNLIVFDTNLGSFFTLTTPPVSVDESNAQIAATVPDNKFKFLTVHQNDADDWEFTFSDFNNNDFKDWEHAQSGVSADPLNYNSFIETSYIFGGGGIAREKRAPYLFCHFNITEDGTTTDSNGNIVYRNPSGCILEAFWDYTSDGKTGKVIYLGDVYRLPRNFLPSSSNSPFDIGYDITHSKHKIRGSGKALTLKFSSVDGKDFQFLGFNVMLSVRGNP